jgi:hypothetical protein
VFGLIAVPALSFQIALLGGLDRPVFLVEALVGPLASLDPLCQLDLLLRRQQRVAADLAQIGAEGVQVPEALGLLGPERLALLGFDGLDLLRNLREQLGVFDVDLFGFSARKRQLRIGQRHVLFYGFPPPAW